MLVCFFLDQIHHADSDCGTDLCTPVHTVHCKGHTFSCAFAADIECCKQKTPPPTVNKPKKSAWTPESQKRPSRNVKKSLSEQIMKRAGRSAERTLEDANQSMMNVYSPAEAERAFCRSLSEGASVNHLRQQAVLTDCTASVTAHGERATSSSSSEGSLLECDPCIDNVSEKKLDDDEALFEDIMAAVGNVNELLETDSMMFVGSRTSAYSRTLNINRLCRQHSLPLENHHGDDINSGDSPGHRRLSRSYGDYATNDFMAQDSCDSYTPRSKSDDFGEVSSLQLAIGEVDTLPRQPKASTRSQSSRITVL